MDTVTIGYRRIFFDIDIVHCAMTFIRLARLHGDKEMYTYTGRLIITFRKEHRWNNTMFQCSVNNNTVMMCRCVKNRDLQTGGMWRHPGTCSKANQAQIITYIFGTFVFAPHLSNTSFRLPRSRPGPPW